MSKSLKLKKLAGIVLQGLVVAFVAVVLALSIRGLAGNPTAEELNSPTWKEEGPFELSPERGRFALTYSVLEDKSVSFSIPIARFTTPDLGYTDGRYVSLFAPAVSYLVMPGYLVGQAFGISQVGTYAAVAVFAVLNFLLILQIARNLGANKAASILAGLMFLFATPAFAYGVSLYQHHISTFLILAGIYLLVRFPKQWLAKFAVFFLCALGVAVDNPNLFMMFPIGLFALLQMVKIEETVKNLKFKINPLYLIALTGAIVPIVGFFYSNYISYGDPLQLAGTVNSVDAVNEAGQPVSSESILTPEELAQAGEFEEVDRSSVGFFEPRDMVNGLYTHLLSPDRGILYFTPVVLVGVIGIFVLYKSGSKHLPLLLSVLGVNLIVYSMWGDPWGGWAFGSRYLIPGYAIMAIFTAMALTRFARNILVLLLFFGLLLYSIGVNTLGAITTSAIPPKVQAIPLEALTGREEKYNYRRNWDYLNQNGSKSYVYQQYLEDKISPRDFYTTLVGAISVVSLLTIFGVYLTGKKIKNATEA